MSNGFIGDLSWRKECTFSASSADSDYPATNLQNDELSRVWRSESVGEVALEEDTIVRLTFADLRTINVIAICNHNLSRPTAAVRVRLYNDTDETELTADSGVLPIWDVIYEEDDPQASWDSGNAWDRIMSATDTFNRDFQKGIYFTDSPTAVRVVIEFFDEENPDGYVQVGIIEPASGFFLPLNYEYGAQYGLSSRTQRTQAEGGTYYSQPQTPLDVFRGGSGLVLRQQALSLFYEFLRRADLHTYFWWSPDIDDRVNELRHSYLAINSQVDLLTQAAWIRDNVTFNFERVL